MSQSLKIDDEFLTLPGVADELGPEWSGFPEVDRREVITPEGAVSSVRSGRGAGGGRPAARAGSRPERALVGRCCTRLGRAAGGHRSSGARVLGRGEPTAGTPRRLIAPAVATAVGALAPAPSLVVGVSFGGLTTIALAALRPGLVRAIALVDVLPRFKTPVSDSPAPEAKADPQPAAPARFASREEIVDSLSEGSPLGKEAIVRSVAANTTQLDDGNWVWRFDAGVERDARRAGLPRTLGRSIGRGGTHSGRTGREVTGRRRRCCGRAARAAS